MTDFFLRSIELRESREAACLVLKAIDNNKLLVSLSPALPAHAYGQDNDLDRIVLAPRHAGTSLLPQISA